MDHDEAIRQKATERYLLDELEPETRDEFEEHLFDCQDCALDLRAAAAFVEQSKVLLRETPAAVPARAFAPAPPRAGWFAWLRPAFAVPVFTLLLLLIGYQQFAYHSLQEAANTPRFLPFASINVSTRGPSQADVSASSNESFQLLVNIPPDNRYSSYRLDLYRAQGQLEWSGTIPAASPDDTRSLYIPGAGHDSGGRTLAVHGITANGESVDLGRYPIQFQNKK